jgi:hypothetical protein
MSIDLKKKVQAEIEVFMAKVQRETGVSRRFLEAARPAIEKTFLEIPEKNRPQCFDAIWETARQQAESEERLVEVKIVSEKFAMAERNMATELSNLKRQVTDTRQKIAKVAANMYTILAKNPAGDDYPN